MGKVILGGVAVLIVLALIGSLAQQPSGGTSASSSGQQATPRPPTATREATATTVPPTAVPAPEPIVLNGRGQSVVDVQLTRGLARFAMKHTGQSNFAILLMTSDGQRASSAGAASETLLANQIGTWEGQQAVRVERAGGFVLQVTADGPWSVTITY